MRRGGSAASGGRRHGPCVSGGPGKERYIVFDEWHVGAEDLPGRNLIQAVLGLEQSRTPKDVMGRARCAPPLAGRGAVPGSALPSGLRGAGPVGAGRCRSPRAGPLARRAGGVVWRVRPRRARWSGFSLDSHPPFRLVGQDYPLPAVPQGL